MIYAHLIIASFTALVASAPSNPKPAGPALSNNIPNPRYALHRRGFGYGGYGGPGFGGYGGFGDCGFGGCGGCGGFGGCGGWGGCGPTIIDNACCNNQECFHDECYNCNTEAAAFCNSESASQVDANCCNNFDQNLLVC